MKILKQILFYYQMVFSIFLIILGLVSKALLASPAFLLVLVPVLLYLCGYLLLNYKKNNQSQGQVFWIILSLLLLYNLLSTTLLFLSNLLLTKSLYNLFISLLYLPFPLYYYLAIATWYKSLQHVLRERAKAATPAVSTSASHLPVNDQQRRRFLKLVGGTSLSLILMSLVNPKQAGAAFFGSVPGPGTVAIKNVAGAKIDPAEKQPTDGYKISQVDDTTYPAYYGFVDATGAWYIMKEDSSSNYRYCKGASSFSTNWTNRAGLSYDYYDAIF